MSEKPPEKYQHKEAFCLMKYREEGSVPPKEEWLWNSRDGVTPYTIGNRDGTRHMVHVQFHLDRCVPDHLPAVGDRIFVDLQPDRAIEHARRYVADMWEHAKYPMKHHPLFGLMNREEATGYYARDLIEDGCRPDIITVTDHWLAQNAARFANRPGGN